MSMIGHVVKLTRACLGNPVGTVGFVVEEYKDFDGSEKPGLQIIFANGEHDGFSVADQELFLEFVEGNVHSKHARYEFTNVIRMYDDYKKGYWNFDILNWTQADTEAFNHG